MTLNAMQKYISAVEIAIHPRINAGVKTVMRSEMYNECLEQGVGLYNTDFQKLEDEGFIKFNRNIKGAVQFEIVK